MVVLFLGKKGYGKSTAARRILSRRLRRHPTAVIFAHDPKCQIGGGVVFTSIDAARSYFATRGLPRLAVFRGVDVEPLATLAVEIGGLTLYLDELDRACDGKKFRAPTVQHIVNETRWLGVDLIGTFRTLRSVSEDLLFAADFVFLFHVPPTAEYDLGTIRRRLGADAVAATQLDRGEFLLWHE